MIAHKTFAKRLGFYTARGAVNAMERLKREAETFVANEVGEEDVVGFTENYVNTFPNLLTVTVWYRKR